MSVSDAPNLPALRSAPLHGRQAKAGLEVQVGARSFRFDFEPAIDSCNSLEGFARRQAVQFCYHRPVHLPGALLQPENT
jgi:hypothetical protein